MLYTNEDGTKLVAVLDKTGKGYTYRILLPQAYRAVHFQWKDAFEEAYPVKVDGVVVEKGANKAYGVAASYLYSDGKRAVYVERCTFDRVTFWEIYPRVRGNYTMAPRDFLHHFPYELDGLELD